MEQVLRAPVTGKVAELRGGGLSAGDLVGAGETVASIECDGAAAAAAGGAAGAGAEAGGAGAVVAEEEDSWDDVRNEIARRRVAALACGGEAAVARHHAQGRRTVRENIGALLDGGAADADGGGDGGAGGIAGFAEVGRIAGSVAAVDDDSSGKEGVAAAYGAFSPANFVLGTGPVGGRTTVVCGEDFTQSGGSPSSAGLRKSMCVRGCGVACVAPPRCALYIAVSLQRCCS